MFDTTTQILLAVCFAVVVMTMLYFVLFVTGIPPSEAQSLASRGEDYRRYRRTTSRFIPWFPRKEQGLIDGPISPQ